MSEYMVKKFVGISFMKFILIDRMYSYPLNLLFKNS